MSCIPDCWITLSCQTFLWDRVDVVSEFSQSLDKSCRQILIEFDLHAILGTLGRGISSSAEAAAKAITARKSCAVNVGKSSRIS